MNTGLCEKCRHAKIITSDRGSTFIMCEMSKTDKSFPKYPRLPVLVCSGYVEKRIDAASSKEKFNE
jgi:hypothetical protein